MYRGRFAPTPSGPLHFGSMVAAVGSWLDARAHRGEWLLRIDDLDTPRVAPGASDAIRQCLERFGLHWDGEVIHQGDRAQAYDAAVERLRAGGWVFACACTRREIEEAAVAGPEGAVYPGTCREGIPSGKTPRSLRMRVGSAAVEFHDALQGRVYQDLASAVGDFVLRRPDGIHAYHLACAVDDAAQGVTHVVRGADLMASTPRQIYVQQRLGLATPAYLHLPVAAWPDGQKLSKQTLAPTVDPGGAPAILGRVLAFLNQPAPPPGAGVSEILRWGIEHWDRGLLPRTHSQPVPKD